VSHASTVGQQESADLVIDGVGHTYRSQRQGDVVALAPTDLAIAAGAFVALVGPSGSGKSTLLEIVAGLRRPSTGRVLLGGVPVVGPGRRRGVVFQQPTSLLPWRTVAGNVELGLQIRGLAAPKRRKIVAAELERVDLGALADRRVYELSGGQQQRVQIARALAADPEVLLLDEPFGALDTFTREALQEQLRSIWRTTGKTVLLVTHSVEEAALLATRIVVLSPRPGTVIADLDVGFARRDLPAAQVRALPEFVEVAAELRSTIGGTTGES